jgi:hypothetical protein
MDWIWHFNMYIKWRAVSIYRLLVLNSYKSHYLTNFKLNCKENDIITLCMPPHSSHLLQPIDVSCFGPLKAAFGKQIEVLMRANITYRTSLRRISFLRFALPTI